MGLFQESTVRRYPNQEGGKNKRLSLLEEGRNTTSFTKCYFPLLTAVAYTPFIFQVTLQFCFAYLSRLHLNNARKSTLETNVASDLRRLRHCMHCMNTSFQVHGHITITHFTT